MLRLWRVIVPAHVPLLQVLVVGPRHGAWGIERYGVAPCKVRLATHTYIPYPGVLVSTAASHA